MRERRREHKEKEIGREMVMEKERRLSKQRDKIGKARTSMMRETEGRRKVGNRKGGKEKKYRREENKQNRIMKGRDKVLREAKREGKIEGR